MNETGVFLCRVEDHKDAFLYSTQQQFLIFMYIYFHPWELSWLVVASDIHFIYHMGPIALDIFSTGTNWYKEDAKRRTGEKKVD